MTRGPYTINARGTDLHGNYLFAMMLPEGVEKAPAVDDCRAFEALPDLIEALRSCRDSLREYLESVESGKDDDAESAYQCADAILTELEVTS